MNGDGQPRNNLHNYGEYDALNRTYYRQSSEQGTSSGTEAGRVAKTRRVVPVLLGFSVKLISVLCIVLAVALLLGLASSALVFHFDEEMPVEEKLSYLSCNSSNIGEKLNEYFSYWSRSLEHYAEEFLLEMEGFGSNIQANMQSISRGIEEKFESAAAWIKGLGG